MYKEGSEMRLDLIRERFGIPNAILDVGAHRGQFFTWSKKVWPDTPIWMIEANEIHEPYLKELCSKYNDQYLISTLGDSNRNVNFYTRSDKPTTEGASYYKETTYWDIPHLVKEIPKTLQTLDELFEEGSYFDLVKLDTQGSEVDILKGGSKLCQKAAAIIVEVSYIDYNEGAPKSDEVIKFMSDYGYGQYFEIGEHYSNEPQWKDIAIQKDLCFYK